jgi:peptidoglycan/LPS O-acetylase OafA/YrhL
MNFANNKNIPQLDGLRGIAILLVLLVHSQESFRGIHLDSLARRGWIGVDLFFVLSGFLITGILLDTKGRGAWLRNFYARRALRIWPLYYAVLLFIFVLVPIAKPSNKLELSHYPWYWYFSYLQNWFVRGWGIAPLSITWSLAVEEQFYMSWPIVVLVSSRKGLRNVLVATFLLSPLLRWVAISLGSSWVFTYTFTGFRLDSIALGGLMALFVRSEAFSATRLRRISMATFGMGGLAVAINFARRPPEESPHSAIIYTLLALTFSGALGLALVTSGGFLKNSVLRYVGKISYGLYLLHLTVFSVYDNTIIHYRLHDYLLLDTAIRHLLLFGVVTASWYLFESPILTLKSKFEDRQPKTVAVMA